MNVFAKCLLFILILAISGATAFSAEEAVLLNGAVIRLDHRETRGDVTRLFLDPAAENYVDVRRDQIDRFEQLDELPATPVTKSEAVRTFSVEQIVAAAAHRYGVDADLVFSLIHAESAFDLNAVSPKGALGLMQLMPSTATRFGVRNPMDPAGNVEGGTRYLSELLTLYNNNIPKALAAYNAGPSRIKQYHGVPPYPETISYVARIVRDLNQRKASKSRVNSPRANQDGKGQSF
ncbi:MAG TPA: lytic transglycosylase domain-containing protein [Candidatus Saccharimonadales bacterium]|jgi:soluble lytic murein transglycosylase-like protein|nr:lytic transglycosylase domain-containing protein [Candidatus Saccharimonadales bacterium]